VVLRRFGSPDRLDHEIVTTRNGYWSLSTGVSEIRSLIPSGVQSMIRLEIAQMAIVDRRMLEWAAVQGVIFDSGVVSTTVL
jgi:hypothetical protein